LATAVLAFTLPGIPLLYNGEEVGNDRPLSLFEKVEIDWKKNPEFRDLYRKLGALRAEHVALRRGEYVKLLNTDSAKVYSFVRRSEDDASIVVINFDRTTKSVRLSLPPNLGGEWTEYFSKTQVRAAEGLLELTLGPLEYMVFLSPARTAQQ
jgi:glycosidase